MLTSTTTSLLRSGVARSCAIQPAQLLRGPACQYSTFKATPLTLTRNNTRLTSPKPTTCTAIRSISTTTVRPQQSTTDHDLDAAAAAKSSAQAQKQSHEPPLDWNTFFQLRKTRRRWQLFFSAVGSLTGGTTGAMVLSTGAAEALVSQVPLDPMITLGLMTFGSAALGWLAGPALGSQVFYALNRKYQKQMTVKETQFFARVKKNRVDPTNSSAGNPVPDFYGEKISSVAGYRQWLKDQRAFNKKRTTFV